MNDDGFCFYSGTPPGELKYKVVARLKVGKKTYGGVRDELPKFVAEARAAGADAIANYNGSQRFGFWPWRLVRPVLTGSAIKWITPPTATCEASGGSTLATILATNQEPPLR